MKVLITHPHFDDPGGVANYYKKLRMKFSIPVIHFFIGTRPGENGKINLVKRFLLDYLRFLKTLIKEKPGIICVNPSLDRKSFIRDNIYIFLSRLFGKKTIVFYRGLHPGFQKKIEKKERWLFNFSFLKTDAAIVLSNEFSETLKSWGYRNPVFKETTIIDDFDLKGFDIKKIIKKRLDDSKWKILFLARINKEKGIYETIETFRILLEKEFNLELIIAGEGRELQEVKKYVIKNNIRNIIFSGYVRGLQKRQLFESSHLFCFPSYSEGMPNSVIEAMAYGLPVVTRTEGGIIDFFKNGINGFMTYSKDPAILSEFTEKILLDQKLYNTISINNYTFARQHFLASNAAKRLEKIYGKIVNT